MLSGHSSSALFVGYAFFMESPANHRFNAFISADGSFWQQPPEVTQAEATMFMANAGRSVPLALLLGADATGNVVSVRPLYATLLARNYAGLQLVEREYNAGHVGMDIPFFRDALQVLFGV
jgi:hypothetical protein